VQDSCPNYAKIDHFNSPRSKNGDESNDDDEVVKPPAQKTLSELLVEARAEIAREFDQRYQASLEELDMYKVQLEQSQKEAERRQAQIGQRQIAEKDRQLQQLTVQKQELEEEKSQLLKQVAEKEDLVQEQRSVIDQLRSELSRERDLCKEHELRQDVVHAYLEGQKRQSEENRARLEQATEALAELRKQDWSRQILELKRENDFLRSEVTQKEHEMTIFKNNLAVAV
jgi:predicted RNase H-like nuclease (RuvC/YqgF family)